MVTIKFTFKEVFSFITVMMLTVNGSGRGVHLNVSLVYRDDWIRLAKGHKNVKIWMILSIPLSIRFPRIAFSESLFSKFKVFFKVLYKANKTA